MSWILTSIWMSKMVPSNIVTWANVFPDLGNVEGLLFFAGEALSFSISFSGIVA